MAKTDKKASQAEQYKDLLNELKLRFEKNIKRHKGIEWNNVQAKLKSNPKKLKSLDEMELSGGEPDVVGYDKKTGEYIFYDCSAETPKGRRSVCYDHDALESRKEHKPKDSAIGMATDMGIEILSEDQYMDLQKLGSFDSKTSSWVKTPTAVRELGGAISGELRFGRVFIYANGAESYFGARGFRGSLRI
ncbi:DUF4256 domain-containing protein [soil metagenome]